jgi:hypothetical protein
MLDTCSEMRFELLNIIGAVGAIRDHGATLEPADVKYVERELAVMQAAAHRLLEFLEHLHGDCN